MNEYAYKMEGLDKDWTFLKKNRKVYYTKLPPGNYTFKVKGSNSSGIWNQQEARIEIQIYPPCGANHLGLHLICAVFLPVLPMC